MPHDAAVDDHRCVRRGVDGGVLDQLGDHVDDVAHRGPGQPGVARGDDTDPRVVLHLGHGRPDDVHERDRVPPAARGRLAGQDDQALGMPPHPGGQVVDAEQVREFLRILGPALHPVQQRELPVQQRLAAPGQVPEHLADALAEPGLAHGRLHRGPLHLGEGVPHLADLPGLDRDVVQRVVVHAHVHAGGELLDHPGQPVVGQVQGGPAQAGQLTHQPAAGQQRHDDGDHHGQQAEPAGQQQPQVGDPCLVLRLLAECAGRLRPGVLKPERDALHGPLPGGGRHRGQARRVHVADHRVFQRRQRAVRGGADVPLVHRTVGRAQLGQGLVVQRGARACQPGEAVLVGEGEPARGHVGEQQHVLLLEQFPRLGDLLQRQGLRGNRRAGLGEDHLVQQQVGVPDQLVVGSQGLRPAYRPPGDRGMQAGQARGVVQQRRGCLAHRGRGVAERAARGEGAAQGGRHVPGGHLLRAQLREIARAGGRQVDQREHALRIELPEEIAYRLAGGRLQGPGPCQIQGVFTGDAGGKKIEPEKGEHRDEDQK